MITLQQIRDQSPCTEGWTKLLKSLGNPPMDTVISLGDVAKSNDAPDAYWCIRALDWNNEQVRREVIKVLIPSVRRASIHTKDARVHGCISTIKDWIDGKPADLGAAADAAERAAREARAARAADAASAAARAAEAARSAELEAQRADIIAAFPPLVLCQTRAALEGGK